MADNNKTHIVLSLFTVIITTSWLVTAAAAYNVSYRTLSKVYLPQIIASFYT